MTDNEDSFERADREKREFTDRTIEQLAKLDRGQWENFAERLERLRPLRDRFASEVGEHDRIVEILRNAQSEDDALCRLGELGGYAQRDLVAACMRVQRLTAFRVADLERQIADLRSAQQPADPAGAHPYRSAAQCLAVPASSPVAASETAPTSSSAPGAWRRVYGALASRPADVCMALVPALGGVGAYLICASASLDAIGAVLGMALAGLGSVPTLTWWRS